MSNLPAILSAQPELIVRETECTFLWRSAMTCVIFSKKEGQEVLLVPNFAQELPANLCAFRIPALEFWTRSTYQL
jgi:hypothetical protein